jgi:CRP-like cAMP-binding protein
MSKELQFFKERDIVLKEGEVGTEAYLIVKGRAEVKKSGQTLTILKEGDYFGEMGLLLKQPRSATVIALTPLVVEVLSQASFEGMVQRRPVVARQLLTQLSERLARLSERIAKEQHTLATLSTLSLCNSCAPQVQDLLRGLAAMLEEGVPEVDDWLFKGERRSPAE